MPRLPLVALVVAAVFGAVAAPASAALPLDTLSTGANTSPFDVVSTGRYTFFTQGTSKIGRVSEDGSVTEFPSGFDSTGRIIVGPEGTLWFLGRNGGTASKTIGRMTQGGALLAQTQASKDWGTGLTTGADGNVWVGEGEWVAKYAPNGNLIDEYFVNSGKGGFAHDVTAGPDGNIWVAESTLPGASAIGRLTPNGSLTTFTGFVGPACTPASKPVTCLNTEHLAVGPSGNLWYTASKSFDGQVGSVGTISTSGLAADQLLPGNAQPTEIAGGPDQSMYVVSAEAHTLLRLDLLGHVTDTTDLGSFPGGMDLGADGKFWVATGSANGFQRVLPKARPTSGNLIVGGDGESGPRAASATATVPMPGWATSPNFTATTVNPATGTGVLWGGPNNAQSFARQLIDVTSQQSEIDSGNRFADLSAKIGGYGGQDDHGTVKARFTAGDGTVLGTLETDTVTAAQLGGKTGYADRATKGLVPAGTRYIEVELLATRVNGTSNDVFFDDVSLTLTKFEVPPPAEGNGQPTGNGLNGTGTGPIGTGQSGSGQDGTGTTGNGIPQDDQGQDPASIATLSSPTLSATSFKPLAAGGSTTDDPKAAALAIGLSLSRPSSVVVRVDRATAGRKKGKKCVAANKAKRAAKACTRYVAKGSFVVDLPAGPSTIRFTGRLNGKKLPAGRYRLVLTPSGGKPTTLAVRIR